MGLKRARSRGPGGPRDAHVGPTCSLRERRMREVYRYTGDLQQRERDQCGIPCQHGRRVKTEEEKPGSPLKRGDDGNDDDDDDEFASDEESGEHSRRVENAAGATEDGGHRRSSAQERNLTPRTKPNAHRNTCFNL